MLLHDLFETIPSSPLLYHATNLDVAAMILDQNVFLAKTDHYDGQMISHRGKNRRIPHAVKGKHLDQFEKVWGISFSRSDEFPKKWVGFGQYEGGVILVVDRNKVQAENRINPIKYYAPTSKYKTDETEDFVIGNIRNVDRKLVHVMVSQQTYEWMKEWSEDPSPEFDSCRLILNHPKLKVV